jgi:hypothetical protein
MGFLWMIKYFRLSSVLVLIFDKSQTLFNCFSFDFIFMMNMRAGGIIITLCLKMHNLILLIKWIIFYENF